MVKAAYQHSLELEADDALEAVQRLIIEPTAEAILDVARSVHQMSALIQAMLNT